MPPFKIPHFDELRIYLFIKRGMHLYDNHCFAGAHSGESTQVECDSHKPFLYDLASFWIKLLRTDLYAALLGFGQKGILVGITICLFRVVYWAWKCSCRL